MVKTYEPVDMDISTTDFEDTEPLGFSLGTLRIRTPLRKGHNCTEKDLAITVKCRQEAASESSAMQNQSSCCSFSALNSSHPSEACAPVSEERGSMSSSNAKSRESGTLPDCLIRITAARSDSNSYLLRTCERSNVQLQCEGNVSCSDVVRWRSADGSVFDGRTLLIQNVQTADGGTYTCEVTDYFGKIKTSGAVKVEVKFSPVITVPNSSVSVTIDTDDMLECQSEGRPPPTITWLQDGVPFDPSPSSYVVSSKSSRCKTTSYVIFKLRNASEDVLLENFTCVAENELGKAIATFLIATFTEELTDVAPGARRRFNVTGFIVGMLPPLLISFYIILKLGYRSRYAEERGEDDGFREEPFFISY